jgi:hypothetical protein
VDDKVQTDTMAILIKTLLITLITVTLHIICLYTVASQA